MEPQQVEIGNPKTGVSWPSGIGAGVECSRVSFSAKERPEPPGAEEPRSRKSVARKNLFGIERAPWAKERGQKLGTVSWIALREACSPESVS